MKKLLTSAMALAAVAYAGGADALVVVTIEDTRGAPVDPTVTVIDGGAGDLSILSGQVISNQVNFGGFDAVSITAEGFDFFNEPDQTSRKIVTTPTGGIDSNVTITILEEDITTTPNSGVARFFSDLAAFPDTAGSSFAAETFVDTDGTAGPNGFTSLDSILGINTNVDVLSQITTVLPIGASFTLQTVINISHGAFGPNANTEVFTRIEAQPIPLPASAWMLLSAMGGIGFLSYRNRRAAG
ncbi:MAG: VPLPA-CTERM sorting domain-containing protein [Pseudomonadota bacterium]